jgi:hypothetical protein
MGKKDHHKINNSEGSFMPVIIERLYTVPKFINGKTATVYSLSHYYEQNGDLVPDPDMTFAVDDVMVVPLTYQDSYRYDESLFKDGNEWKFKPALQKSLVSFANMWMINIKEQQEI